MARAQSLPFATREVRWFFDGRIDHHPALLRWFEGTGPIPRASSMGPPEWIGRLDDKPDVYLLVPGSDDMGIKWREGQLQIKGRVSSLGVQVFGGRHQGLVERWIKWSYPNLPSAYARLFTPAQQTGLVTVPVRKVRTLRKISLDSPTGAQEVALTTMVDRGIGCELTELEAGGKQYCSVAFEGFPDDPALKTEFIRIVTAFLEPLTEIALKADESRSYPAWLLENT